jgi:hypothetical protein
MTKMKLLKYILASALAAIIAVACNEGIDPISRVEPGPDETAPAINITFPVEGTEIKVASDVASINIEFEVTDDIEVQQVQVLMDGSEIATFNEFKDYRRFLGEVLYDDLVTGDHTLTVNATDMEAKTTSKSVNFSKVPPYVPRFAGEIFYMPFDQTSGFTELVSFTNPAVVGSPGLTDDGLQGAAYAGATDSYLTFPTTGLQGNEFSAFFWMKVNAVPNRAGVLVMGPPDPNNPSTPNLRTSGFRFFREDAGGKQRFKLNVGNGTADSWFDGGAAADVDPTLEEWVSIAFTISGTQCVVYINGQVVSQGAFTGVSWEGCDILSIMSGAPRFLEWDHKSDLSYMDELRLFNKELTQDEVQSIIGQTQPYEPQFDGEMFYMPFNGNNADLVSGNAATVVGAPGFSDDGKSGQAYEGATDGYLTYPTTDILTEEFSAAFWYKLNATPDRSGILTIGPPDPNLPATPNNRTSGFRLFRENAGGMQRIKLNVGNGSADSWFDGGAAADIDPSGGDWVHIAFTISNSDCVVYINGVAVSQGAFTGVDWTGCDIFSIASGEPRFTEWGHLSDLSLYDELRLFNKALTQEEVVAIMND